MDQRHLADVGMPSADVGMLTQKKLQMPTNIIFRKSVIMVIKQGTKPNIPFVQRDLKL